MTNNTTVTRIPLFPSIEAGRKGSAPRSEWGLALKEHISYSGVTFLLQIGRAKGREVLLSCKKRPPARANRMWGTRAFLLICLAARFLAFSFSEISFVFPFAFVLGGTGLVQRNGDGLAAAPDLAALAAASAFELAVLEFAHNATGGLSLTGRCLRPRTASWCAPVLRKP